MEERTSWNLVATKHPGNPLPSVEAESETAAVTPDGAISPTSTVVIGAHIDSVPRAPGANDNASGSAVVLELARQYATIDYPHTLQFVLFGAEELGLYGSEYFVSTLGQEQRQAIVAMLNLDMVGVGEAWRFGGTDALAAYAAEAARSLDAPYIPLTGPVSSASDHASFLAVGIPAVFLHRTNDPNYHQPTDLPEHVDPTALDQAATISHTILERLR